MADFNMKMNVGEERTLNVHTLLSDKTFTPSEIVPTWLVSNNSLAEIFDASGDRSTVKVRALAAGVVTITVGGQVNGAPVSKTLEITVVASAVAMPTSLEIMVDGNPIGKI